MTVDFLIPPSLEGDRAGRLRDIEPDFAAIIAPGLRCAFRDRQRVTIGGRTLFGEKAAGRPQPQHEYLYWEAGPKRAVRCGQWKLVGTPKQWELYDLAADIEEQQDVAAKHPDVVRKLAAYAEQAHTPNTWGEWIDKSKSFRVTPEVKSYAP